jgi:hypothetical protein
VRNATLLCSALVLVPAGSIRADEGQWTPDQIHELDPDLLARKGLALKASDLWNDQDGGLMRAVINLSGCTAAFVSRRGLIATNHHCIYSAIQGQSTVEHDYLRGGFLAREPEEKLEAKGRTVRVLRSIRDVTERVRKAVDEATDDTARARAVESTQKSIVKECEDQSPALRCRVASFYNGSSYQLSETLELRDIRIVYAPPSAIGDYGGKIDNWMWPRHTGDFALVRAYVGPDGQPADHSPDNVPYRPEHRLRIGHTGVLPGDFVAVLGYPGRTSRYLAATEVERRLEQRLPATVELCKTWIGLLEALGTRDPEVELKVAAKLKGLTNRHKNARGMIDGLGRMKLLARRQEEDRALRKWAKDQSSTRYAEVLDELAALSEERRATFPHDFLLGSMTYGPGSLAIAVDVVRRAKEREKPDLERESAYMDRNEKRLWRSQERRLRNFDRRVDTALLEDLLRRVATLPKDQRFLDTPPERAAGIIAKTRMSDAAHVKTLFDAAEISTIEASKDPLLVMARRLVEEIEKMETRQRTQRGKGLRLGPVYFEMLKAVRRGPIYPDANGTLRFSYANVEGYSPQDGLQATAQTRLEGAIEKHTGVDPFDLPEMVRTRATEGRKTYWSDPELGDIPICFLSNADTTGGNSGSPVINGRGELVGLNFDRVWENIAGDFGYSPERSRSISADVRYMLWLLDDVVDAGTLLVELGVDKLRGRPPRKPRGHDAVPAAQLRVGPPGPRDPGCDCRTEARNLPWLAAVLALLCRRRRRRS